jgi:hypothetical protein
LRRRIKFLTKLSLITGVGLDKINEFLDTLPEESIDALYDCAFDDDLLQFFGLKKDG